MKKANFIYRGIISAILFSLHQGKNTPLQSKL